MVEILKFYLLSHPGIAKKMIEYINSLMKICEEKFLPPLTKS